MLRGHRACEYLEMTETDRGTSKDTDEPWAPGEAEATQPSDSGYTLNQLLAL